MSQWQIEPIRMHRFRSPGPEVLFQYGFGEMVEMVIYAFLLRSGDHTVLVDTGLHADHAALNDNIRARKGPEAGFFSAGGTLAEELAARGAVPTMVALTSFGPYAAGGLAALPQVPIIASARGLADLDRAEEPALVHPVPPVAAERLRTATVVTGEAEILPGLRFLEVGIHHPASAALLIDTADSVIAIADPVFVRRNLVEGLALGAAEQAAGWHRMVRLLGSRAGAMIGIHDPDPTPLPRADWHPLLRTAP